MIIFILEGIFIYLNSSILSNLYAERVKSNLKQDAVFIKLLADDYQYNKYSEIFKNSKIRFTLISFDGKVKYDSKNMSKEEYMDNHSDRKEVIEAKEYGEGFDIRESKTLKKTFAYYTTTFSNKYGEKFIIRTSSDYSEEVWEIRRVLFLQILFFLVLNFIIHFFYKNYIKRDFYNRIEKIKRFLQSGEKENTSYLKEEDWFAQFWVVLKEWQGRNLKNIEDLEKERKILSVIIETIDIFIGLIDKDGRFVVKNGVLEYVVDRNREKYIEAIKYIEIIDLIKKAKENNSSITEEIYIQSIKRYFLVNIKLIDFREEILLTIKDITNRKQAVEVQKTFISNVSHELKTPLTNIKGYLIALEDAPENMRKRFLDIILGNVEKLQNIVLDFLNISKIESSNILNKEEVPFKKIIENIESLLAIIIKEKNARIEYDIKLKNEKKYIVVDVEKLSMILKNLVENGIIYNKSKVPIIKIEILEETDVYKFCVEDNGIGIPQYEQYKIFDRFYRVDKARTTNLGGTGLGLPIVKSLVEQCGGSINIFSVENKGTKFNFYIKK